MKKILFLFVIFGFFISQKSFASCSNYTNYVDGQNLTAGSLNSLQSHYTGCVNGILDGDTFYGDMIWDTGADADFYFNNELKAKIDGTNGVSIIASTKPGVTSNCALFEPTSGTIAVKSYSGSDLSASNPCIVTVVGEDAGESEIHYFTSNVTFTYGSSSDTDGNTFGLSADDWTADQPFFLGVVTKGDVAKFVLSRVPLWSTGTTSMICQKGDTDCDGSHDAMILDTGLTLSQWASKPITQLGWLIADSFTTATTSWDFALSTLANGQDGTGFNFGYSSRVWEMDSNATTGYLEASGGVPPATSSGKVYFSVDEKCNVAISSALSGDGGTDGSGAVNLGLTLPYKATDSQFSTIDQPGGGSFYISNPTYVQGVIAYVDDGVGYARFDRNTSATQVKGVEAGDFTNGSRTINGFLRYRCL